MREKRMKEKRKRREKKKRKKKEEKEKNEVKNEVKNESKKKRIECQYFVLKKNEPNKFMFLVFMFFLNWFFFLLFLRNEKFLVAKSDFEKWRLGL